MKSVILLSLLPIILCVKLVPIVRMFSEEGLNTYPLNGNETIALGKKGFKKFEEAGYLLSVEEYDNLKEKCPDLRAIIRYATNFGGKIMYRLSPTYDLTSKSVIGFAVLSSKCGANAAVREFSAKTQPDHIYMLSTLKKSFPPYSKYVMSGTPFYVWTKDYTGDFTDRK